MYWIMRDYSLVKVLTVFFMKPRVCYRFISFGSPFLNRLRVFDVNGYDRGEGGLQECPLMVLANAVSSVHAFMISCILSRYKDIVHLLPVNSINTATLHTFISNIINGLE